MARFKVKGEGFGGFMAWVFGVLLSFAAIYAFYWVFKSFSYWLFYEDMVQDTVKEMLGRYVKPESLK